MLMDFESFTPKASVFFLKDNTCFSSTLTVLNTVTSKFFFVPNLFILYTNDCGAELKYSYHQVC